VTASTVPVPTCTAGPPTHDATTQRFTVTYVGRTPRTGGLIVISSPYITNGGTAKQVRATATSDGLWRAVVDFSIPNAQIGTFQTVDVRCEPSAATSVQVRRTA
jgi:hypothetical protein